MFNQPINAPLALQPIGMQALNLGGAPAFLQPAAQHLAFTRNPRSVNEINDGPICRRYIYRGDGLGFRPEPVPCRFTHTPHAHPHRAPTPAPTPVPKPAPVTPAEAQRLCKKDVIRSVGTGLSGVYRRMTIMVPCEPGQVKRSADESSEQPADHSVERQPREAHDRQSRAVLAPHRPRVGPPVQVPPRDDQSPDRTLCTIL